MTDASSTADWVTILVGVLPLLVFFVAFMFLTRRYNRSRSGETLIDIQMAMLEQVKAQNRALDRIAAALEKKNAG